jgi:hypothetical protein
VLSLVSQLCSTPIWYEFVYDNSGQALPFDSSSGFSQGEFLDRFLIAGFVSSSDCVRFVEVLLGSIGSLLGFSFV